MIGIKITCVCFSFSVLVPETKDEYNYGVFLFFECFDFLFLAQDI